MGRAIDAAGIQFRMLNKSKGPAVRGPRSQADRKLYRQAMQAILNEQPNLTIIGAAVEDIRIEGGQVRGVVTGNGDVYAAPKVIRSEEHTSELQSLMRISYAVFCLKKKKNNKSQTNNH